jgi:preprotein translocase subunit SecF
MSDKHQFRYLLAPGSNFAFVQKFKIWLIISCVLMAASITTLFVNKATRGEYMNWTIDFKGGTEIYFAFKDKDGHYIPADPGKVRDTLDKAGENGFEVGDVTFTAPDGTCGASKKQGAICKSDLDCSDGVQVVENSCVFPKESITGMIVRTPRFQAHEEAEEAVARDAFMKKFEKDRQVEKASWSGDRLFVRAKKPIKWEEAAQLFASIQVERIDPDSGKKSLVSDFELKPWSERGNNSEVQQYTHPDEGTQRYNEVFSIWGVDRQIERALEKGLGVAQAQVVNSYGVGAKAGDKLRDDAAKSVVYAIFLIMLYLAFRFDVRYAPGAAFATIHDAVMVIGVFAVTWSEVSLTSVAGLLTVMGYSVNDTVIVFDRIRENQAKLKDKKLERIIDISLNEMLVRTILTSSTVFATTFIMNIFGTGLVKNFAFAMNIGVIVGTYSSIFLATPIFMWVSRKWYSGAPIKRRPPPVVQQPDTSGE